jgi:hypothetical protein
MADDGGSGSRRGLLVGVAVVLVILAAAVALIHELGASARLQDCVLSGRTNCAPIPTPGR